MATIIIGASLSGLVTAYQLKQRDPTRKVIVIEQTDAENLRKRYAEKNDWVYFPEPAELEKIEFLWQTEVTEINADEHKLVCLQDEQPLVLSYDQLIVATGSSYSSNQSKLSRYQNTYLYRAQVKYTIDSQKFAAFKRVAILGYDETSLQLANKLVSQGKNVSLLHYRNSVLFQFFDHEMIEPFEKDLIKKGITYYPQVTFCQPGVYKGNITSLDLGEEKLPVDCVIYFAPTFPNTKLLRGVVELNDDLTVKTDEKLQTSQKDIFAVGDIVAFREKDGTNKYLPSLHWEVQTAQKVAQLLLAQTEASELEETPFSTQVFDHFLASYGVTQDLAPYRGINDAERIDYQFAKQTDWCGKIKAVFEKESQQLLGVQLVSHCPVVAEFKVLSQMVQKQATLEELQQTLSQLFGRLVIQQTI